MSLSKMQEKIRMYVRFCLNMHKETMNSGDLEETEITTGCLRVKVEGTFF